MTKHINYMWKKKKRKKRIEPSNPKRTKGSRRCIVSIDRSTNCPSFIRLAGCHTSFGCPRQITGANVSRAEPSIIIQAIYYYPSLRNPLSSKCINGYKDKTGLLDILRKQNTDKPCRASRLDYFLISEDILSLNPKADIHNAYKSDTNSIGLSILKSSHACTETW